MKHLFYPSLVLAAFCTAGTSLGHAQQPKQLNVKKVQVSAPVEAQDVPALMDRNGVEFQPIDQVNWKEYPYKPQAAFRIAHTGKEILVNYRVTEASVRAVAAADNGKVWEDACAEFFVSPEANDFYYNFECNCAAKLLIQAGRPGDRPMADPAVVATVKRWSSLGSEPFEERVGECTWELALVIPATAFFRHHLDTLDGKVMKGNFYKCGDKLQTPHFLSWSPIRLEKPQFHCPQFFGTLNFE